ncbi:hypothetical protein CYMTET_23994 [Cymbomonas tetramitiformis]|uniref:DNA-(apurinic or apyrimidinic site) lyase n=1 Tax=Cymbomonas tetramitiformis TaxID=36881 RepID=A0AAE0L0N7_9CHLO|nr:hypothetical protein CYMTET_23994 [Cymbomonas tetramitiformis]
MDVSGYGRNHGVSREQAHVEAQYDPILRPQILEARPRSGKEILPQYSSIMGVAKRAARSTLAVAALAIAAAPRTRGQGISGPPPCLQGMAGHVVRGEPVRTGEHVPFPGTRSSRRHVKKLSTRPTFSVVAAGRGVVSLGESCLDSEADRGVATLSSLRVADLRARLKEAGLSTSGLKAELLSRLEEHLLISTAPVAAGTQKGAAAAVVKFPKKGTKKEEASIDPTLEQSGQAPKRKLAMALEAATSNGTPAAKRRAKRSPSAERSPRKRTPAAKAPVAPPKGWRGTYDLIVELRADRTAVVDSMGSEAIDEDAAHDTPLEVRRYQTLVSLMLSSQTKDTVNAATMVRLREWGLTVDHILDRTSDEQLFELIKAVGFNNTKVKNIRRATQILRDEYGSNVPDSLEQLMALPGVGPKMALIVLRVSFGRTEGISVDTHVHRIANQLGWTGGQPGETKTKQPEQTRAALEQWIPTDLWPDVNILLVGLGQEVQTEREKLLAKCRACSDPPAALHLMQLLGLRLDDSGQRLVSPRKPNKTDE